MTIISIRRSLYRLHVQRDMCRPHSDPASVTASHLVFLESQAWTSFNPSPPQALNQHLVHSIEDFLDHSPNNLAHSQQRRTLSLCSNRDPIVVVKKVQMNSSQDS